VLIFNNILADIETHITNTYKIICVWRPSSARSLDGTAALAEVIGWCQNLEKPERIRSRGLRKYLATACQVLSY